MLHIHNDSKLAFRRRSLRKSSTVAERILWEHLRNRALGYKIRRQYSIGPYIIDFCCTEKKLAIEIDGLYHNKTTTSDTERVQYLELVGYKVLRFTNEEIYTNLECVINEIKKCLDVPSPK